MTFEDDLAAAKAAERRTLDVSVDVNGKLYKFRFTQMIGTEYAAETLLHAPNLEVALHREYGYDVHALSRAVAHRCAVLVEGKKERALSKEQWAELFEVLDGGAQGKIANTVFELNEFATAKAVAAARKVLDGSALN